MDIILAKSLLATLAFALALLNLLVMGQLYGKLRLFPLGPETLSRWHRRQGDVILLLCLFVAYHCLTGATVDPKDWRVLAHAILGVTLLALIVFKVVVVRFLPRVMTYIAIIGSALFLSTTGVFLTSAFWYFLTWWQSGARPSY
jgi:hypothetical protein